MGQNSCMATAAGGRTQTAGQFVVTQAVFVQE